LSDQRLAQAGCARGWRRQHSTLGKHTKNVRSWSWSWNGRSVWSGGPIIDDGARALDTSIA